ncbi:MAG: transposase [Candidatus Hydrogenedentes bacterium]|nr:transposase [Candidatus Hydrogenedentota bacterium]
MPRTARIVLPGVAHHVTQRGNQKQQVFFDEQDRRKYLTLLKEHTREHGLRILGYCLMTNHVHLVGVPAREESLAKAVGGTHQSYTAYLGKRYEHVGHLWQSRFFSCPMDEPHMLNALAYVELNPVRAGMEEFAWDHPWSSARAHCIDGVDDALLNLTRWKSQFSIDEWRETLLVAIEDVGMVKKIRSHTNRGRPLGSLAFQEMVRRKMK